MRDMVIADLMKVRTRWMPYVLLIIALAGVALIVWVGGYLTWNAHPGGITDERAPALRSFALPWSLVTLLDSGQYWGAILVGVLTASVVATEHSWGTVRQSLIRGHSRGEYLLSKGIAISIVSGAGLLAALAVGVVFSMLASNIGGVTITLDVPGGPSPLGVIVMILRTGYTILPYGLMAFMITIVTRSTAAGSAGILLYVFIESAVIGLFGAIGGSWSGARAFMLGHNVQSLLAANRIDNGEFNSLSFRPQLLPSQLPDPWVAAAVVALYCGAFGAIAYWSFARRDVRPPDGG